MKDEFVMVPRAELVRLQENLDPHRGAVAWGIACDLLARPAEQHQGEPVALPARKSYEESFSVHGQGQAMGWNACLDEIAKLGPLYTHADPGEVERLRADLAEAQQKYRDELGKRLSGEVKSEAKLAERDALISELEEDRLRMQEGLKDVIDWIGCSQSTGALRTIAEKALSASSEPSVPTWSCQPCKIEQPTDRPCDACSGATELKIWQS